MNLNAAHGILIHEAVHLLLSLLVAFFIWRAFKDKKAALIAFLVGIFLDIDHWFDYFAWFGLKINLRDFFNVASYIHPSGKVFIPFHAWEWLIPLFFVGKLLGRKLKIRNLEWVIVSAFTLHLIWDQISVSPHPLGYFFFYRLTHGFDLEVFDGIR